jgi:hypothetical protein
MGLSSSELRSAGSLCRLGFGGAPRQTMMGERAPERGAARIPDFHEDKAVHHRHTDEIPVKLGQTRAQAEPSPD